MSNNQLGDLKEQQHHPLRGFYAVPPAGLVLLNHHTNENIPSSITHERNIATASHNNVKVTPTAANTIYTAIVPTHRVIHYGSSSVSSSPSISPSSTPAINNNRMSPPFINDPSFNDKANTNQENTDDLPWLAPLLGVLGTFGVVAIIIIYLIGRKRKSTHHPYEDADARQLPPTQPLPNSYQSWASLSTIHTSVNGEEKRMVMLDKHVPPPPAYTTSIKQKRLTADTLVDENNISLMLKNQYSPQLAFSPSLVAGEFQQQQLEEEKPPLPSISPSNTLIDNAEILNRSTSTIKTENYHYSFDQRPKKIEIYEPQVNLHHNNDGNPFIPYSYSNEEQEQKSEEDHKIVAKNNQTDHIVDMNSNSDDK